MTEFEGRGDEVHVLPLSFSEYFCFKQGDKSEVYDDYFLKKIIDNPAKDVDGKDLPADALLTVKVYEGEEVD